MIKDLMLKDKIKGAFGFLLFTLFYTKKGLI